uniref:protein-serine/threonine phosphatase n=1 Tax=Brassica campestris TaxID=3711 RepID=M4FGK2_BRACM
MGCVQCKCCRRYPPSSSSGDSHRRGGDAKVKPNVVVQKPPLSSSIQVPSPNFDMVYSVLSQRGYYPDSPDKENQDAYCIKTELQGNPNVHFFGVFDGHGVFGTQCSSFVKERVVEMLSEDPALLQDPEKAYKSAFLRVNEELHESEIDDSMSGTTAITVLVVGDKIYVANTPFREDECERVKACGARVMTVDQVEGLKDPNIQTWANEESEGGDPPRLWVQNGMYPGTAFTRSVGDCTAEGIGVTAEPEVSIVHLSPNHLFFVVASDGIFEFLPSQAVVDMVGRYADPRDGCAAATAESYKLWLEHENRTDDITIIIVQIKNLSNE